MFRAVTSLAVLLSASPALADDCTVQGSDIVVAEGSELSAKLASLSMMKDQFETDAQFEARAGSQLVQQIPELLGATIVITAPARNGIRYDPERQRLTISSLGHQRFALSSIRPDSSGKGYHGGYIYQNSAPRTYYTAQNGFGASTTVSVSNFEGVGFAWDPKKFKMNNNGSLGSPKNIVLDLPSQKAREFSENAKYVVRGKLIYPFTYNDSMKFGSATFSNPNESRYNFKWYFIDPIAVCVIAQGQTVDKWEIVKK